VPEDLGCFRRHGGARGGAVVSVLFLGARERLERGEESGEQWERKSLSVRFILPLLMHCHAIGLHTCTTLRFPNRLAVIREKQTEIGRLSMRNCQVPAAMRP
jgi:hypothetical protein